MKDEGAGSSVPLNRGFYYEDMPLGFRFHTMGRTITETDLVSFVNMIWFTEELFVNTHDTQGRALQGRVVPASLVYAFSEGLVAPSMHDSGLAFLGMSLEVKSPTYVGDTIHVECEVIEAKLTSKGDRAVVRTENSVKNQKSETVLTYTPLRLVKLKP